MLASAAARLYYAEKGSKQWNRLKEADAFNLNHQDEIFYFSLVDLDNKNLEWSQEIYLDFKFHQDSENFYSFEGDKGMFGILFADSQEAQEFYEVVCKYLEGYTVEEKMPKNTSKSSKSSIFGVFGFGRKSKSSDMEGKAETVEIKTKKSEETKKKKKKSKDADLNHDDVSEPRDFTHLSHIGFNPEKGTFDIQNIPDDWKTLFAKAGITQDQLQNRSTAKFIAGFVQDSESQMREMMQKKKKKPPVPVPMKKKAAPPPPPPTPTKAKKQPPTSPLKSSALPPPPPPKKSSNPRTNVSAPAPPTAPPPPPAPAASASISKPSVAPSAHSALLESIRGAGIGVLKPVKENSIPKSSGSGSSAPAAADPHSALMASIKNGASLKPAPKASPSSPTSSVASTDPTDMMAAMLAKALAARNKKLAADSSDEEEDSDDSRW